MTESMAKSAIVECCPQCPTMAEANVEITLDRVIKITTPQNTWEHVKPHLGQIEAALSGYLDVANRIEFYSGNRLVGKSWMEALPAMPCQTP